MRRIGTRNRLLKRLKYLRNGEILGALGLTIALVYLWHSTGDNVAWTPRLAALFAVCYVLLQGSLYWHLKFRSVASGASLPPYFATVFRFFKWSNVLVIGAVLAALAAALLLARAGTADAAWTGGLLAFAALEHVNYYAYQLMHDTSNDLAYLRKHRRLRRAALAEDLKRARGARQR